MQPKQYLPEDYNPSDADVMCGRGAQCFQHPGNISFRQIVMNHLPLYQEAQTKLQKSMIVIKIINAMGRVLFVRYDNHFSRWFSLTDEAVRQKIGQTIREIMTQRDPIKKVAKAKKRARNYETRKLQKMVRRGSDCSGASDSISSLLSEDIFLDPLPCVARVQSAPMAIQQSMQTLMFPPPLARRTKSDSCAQHFCLADIALASLPPTFATTASREWFEGADLTIADADLSESINSLFEDDDDDRPTLDLLL